MRRRILLGNSINDETVDLGIVVNGAKILFGKCNIGASSETDVGNYYQYGKGSRTYQETSGETNYQGTENPLASTADTATQTLGNDWRMMTLANLYKLQTYLPYEWTRINGVYGTKIYGINGNYIFLPKSGHYSHSSKPSGENYIWSSTPYNSETAYVIYHSQSGGTSSANFLFLGKSREYGCVVRGVKQGTINFNGHQYVDLGLPSGTLWAKCNVGAYSETSYGNYYTFGGGNNQYGNYSGSTFLAYSADTAQAVMGGDWHMPTHEQWNELYGQTSVQEVTISGIRGVKFVDYNDWNNYLFIPYAGYYNNSYGSSSLEGKGSYAYFWYPSTKGSSYTGEMANAIRFRDNYEDTMRRVNRLSVRGVIGLN